MCRKSSLFAVLALFAVGALLVGSASAATIGPITIGNNSFEDFVLADGVTTNGIAGTGWFSPAGLANGGSVDWYGYWNPQDNKFTNATDTSSTLGVPTGGDGRQLACLLASPTRPNELQTLSSVETIQEGTYTLSAGVGCELGYQGSNGALVLGTIDSVSGAFVDLVRTPFAASSVPVGSIADLTTSVTVAAGNPLLGQPLYVRLAITSEAIGGFAATGAGEVAFDNVRLTGPLSTPEPGTLMILASGLVGLLCYAWRKRK